MQQTLVVAAAACLLSACQTFAPGVGGPHSPAGPPGSCPIISSSDWGAWIDAMPGPNSESKLVVSGRVTVPTGGYQPTLHLDQVAESYPVQIFVRLDPNPPNGAATQAVVTQEVRGTWPMQPPVGSVSVRCGAQTLAHISPVETAH